MNATSTDASAVVVLVIVVSTDSMDCSIFTAAFRPLLLGTTSSRDFKPPGLGLARVRRGISVNDAMNRKSEGGFP